MLSLKITLEMSVKVYQEKGYPVQSKHLGKPVGWYVSMDIGFIGTRKNVTPSCKAPFLLIMRSVGI